MAVGTTIVIDIGKTLSKISLWSAHGQMLDRITRANTVITTPDGCKWLDTAGTADWLIETLKSFAAHPVECIIPVAHGAALAGIRDGVLAFASPDYESPLPEAELASYRKGRDQFVLTGSPALPNGLNLGAQIHHLESRDPDNFGEVTLMPYAQYWAWLLTGNAVSEVTSLGCHTDLWNPEKQVFSPMAIKRGWASQFAPIVGAGEFAGRITPQLAQYTGLPASVKVLAGLHDSNAALFAAHGFPEIENREATVLSTGTWFVAMRLVGSGARLPVLPEHRDCLVNVDVSGRPVPSARFMGGREIEKLIELDIQRVDIRPDQPRLLAAVPDVLRDMAMVLPTMAAGTGPFPESDGNWFNRPEDWYARRAAACLYAALVADISLDLIGACEVLLIEGRFAEATVFVQALAALRPDMEVYVIDADTDASFGAFWLANPSLRHPKSLHRVDALEHDLTEYRDHWRAKLRQTERADLGATGA